MVSSRVRPMGVRSYSTRGGMTGWMVRVTMPSRSSPRSVTVSILAVMPSTERCSWLNRWVPCPSMSITYIDHLSPTRCRTSRARQADGSPPASADGQTGSTCPESTRIPPPYPTRLLRAARPAKNLTLQHKVLDASSIAGYYKEARHASELAHKRVLLGGSMTTAAVEIPGYVAGTWTIDAVHSEVSFVIRHMMVSKVRGRFDKFEGTVTTAPDPLQSSVTATVELSSVNTGEPNRDNHIRSADFFEVESHPHLTFRSTGVRPDGD